MLNFINKTKDILGYQRASELRDDESKSLTLLLRCINIIAILYYLDTTLNLSRFEGLMAAFPAFIGLCLFILTFVASYVGLHMNSLTVMLVLIPIVINSFLAVFWNGTLSFMLIPLLGITLVYTSIVLSLPNKMLFSFLITAYIIFMKSYTLSSATAPHTPSSGQILVASVSTLLCAALYIVSVSTYFCMRFTQAEHQVYIYNRQLKKMASLDPLTSIMNRRGMNEILTELIGDYSNGSKGLSIAIGDIDFFKKINDQYGHDAGDYILKTLSSIFSEFMEGKGEVCRWGGEEFLFAFTVQNTDDSYLYLSDLRHQIKHTEFVYNDLVIHITMTFGLEEYSNSAGIEKVIKNADDKLYQGKEAGRDRVIY